MDRGELDPDRPYVPTPRSADHGLKALAAAVDRVHRHVRGARSSAKVRGEHFDLDRTLDGLADYLWAEHGIGKTTARRAVEQIRVDETPKRNPEKKMARHGGEFISWTHVFNGVVRLCAYTNGDVTEGRHLGTIIAQCALTKVPLTVPEQAIELRDLLILAENTAEVRKIAAAFKVELRSKLCGRTGAERERNVWRRLDGKVRRPVAKKWAATEWKAKATKTNPYDPGAKRPLLFKPGDNVWDNFRKRSAKIVKAKQWFDQEPGEKGVWVNSYRVRHFTGDEHDADERTLARISLPLRRRNPDDPLGSLHERIARRLGWTLAEVNSVPLAGLRDLVRSEDPKLVHEINVLLGSGRHILGTTRARKRNPEDDFAREIREAAESDAVMRQKQDQRLSLELLAIIHQARNLTTAGALDAAKRMLGRGRKDARHLGQLKAFESAADRVASGRLEASRGR